jgi:hypothetical protein
MVCGRSFNTLPLPLEVTDLAPTLSNLSFSSPA